jgi:CubicO group peptidase (beta-lactamase class C family)
MNMGSGIRLDEAKAKELMQNPAALKGQRQIQAYLENSAPIPAAPRKFKYQAADPAMTIQVLEAVVPGSAREFIAKELFGKMGITNFNWETDVSGLPKSAAGSGVRSRDMLKWGLVILAKGKWQGEQLIPAAFVERATSPITLSYGKSYYGYFWWVEDFTVGGRTYHSIEGRGAGGQFIFMFPELELIAVFTAHHQGMGSRRSWPNER